MINLWCFFSDQFRNISNCMSIATKIDLMSEGLKEKAQNEGWWDGKTTFNWTEGGLISESFSLWPKPQKKVCQITTLRTIHIKKGCSG